MQKLLTILILALISAMAFAYSNRATEGDAINKLCPIAMEAIDGVTFVEYNGHRIGLCCPGCDKKFLAWDSAKKDAFVKESLESQDSGASNAADASSPVPNEPYTLKTCPVSGEMLGSMGDPIALEVQGRKVRLCCKGCVKTFKTDTAKYLAVVDAGLSAQQAPYYPLETCVVTGEPLVEDGKSVAVDVVIGNRLFRVCCKGCVKKLKKGSGKYLAVLDAAVVRVQSKDYPRKTCIVRDKSKLGSMGDPVQRVVGNRLVQFCCKGCEPAFEKDPETYIAKIDAAWAEHHKAIKKAKAERADGNHGGHDDGENGGH